jgi:hypothetical protein
MIDAGGNQTKGAKNKKTKATKKSYIKNHT